MYLLHVTNTIEDNNRLTLGRSFDVRCEPIELLNE